MADSDAIGKEGFGNWRDQLGQLDSSLLCFAMSYVVRMPFG